MTRFKLIITGFSICLFLFIVFRLIVYFHNPRYSVHVIKSGNGYGYEILLNHTPIIYQSNIPAVSGIYTFKDKVTARKTGRLVIKKLKNNQPPGVTPEELTKLGVTYSKPSE